MLFAPENEIPLFMTATVKLRERLLIKKLFNDPHPPGFAKNKF